MALALAELQMVPMIPALDVGSSVCAPVRSRYAPSARHIDLTTYIDCSFRNTVDISSSKYLLNFLNSKPLVSIDGAESFAAN
ncbi:unnamed protein product [Parnassius apollo]|uniref:(apollo) hypothetical protein n=1 Tax=Parnassius apollo TaxID=110799 RepID=A0A8S3WXN5_PARAO|nr:unnamed protein product [Parnassius apollo]